MFNGSKNLTSSPFRNWNPDTTEATRKREDEMKRESLNTSILSLHFQSRSDMLNHTDETYAHKIMMDYPRIPVRN